MISRPAMLNERRESRASSVIMYLLLAFILLVLVFDLVRAYCLIVVEVKGSSMRDTLYGGELVGNDYEGGDIVYAVRGNAAERGEIVIIDTSGSDAYDPSGEAVFTAQIIIKRLIAVEGDCVKCENGIVYLKKQGGEYLALNEPYAKCRTPDFPEVCVGEGQIFFLGDNRMNSADSEDIVRSGYSLLNKESIVGVVHDWAVSVKGVTTWLENVRASIYGIFVRN